MIRFRPEVRQLIDGVSLSQVQFPDDALAGVRLEVAREHYESARAARSAQRLNAARSAYYESIWYALQAMLASFGLRLEARNEEGQHAVLMRFGRAELRDNADEVEAAAMLDGYRSERNQQMYRHPTDTGLGRLPKHAGVVVDAVARRLGDESAP